MVLRNVGLAFFFTVQRLEVLTKTLGPYGFSTELFAGRAFSSRGSMQVAIPSRKYFGTPDNMEVL